MDTKTELRGYLYYLDIGGEYFYLLFPLIFTFPFVILYVYVFRLSFFCFPILKHNNTPCFVDNLYPYCMIWCQKLYSKSFYTLPEYMKSWQVMCASLNWIASCSIWLLVLNIFGYHMQYSIVEQVELLESRREGLLFLTLWRVPSHTGCWKHMHDATHNNASCTALWMC